MTNKSRWPQEPGDPATGTVALPPLPPGVEGVSDYDQLVGDFTNPILQPWAAEVVKKFGEMSLAGIVYGNPSNQCWPMPMLFIYKQGTVRIIQQPDKVLLIYTGPSTDVRRVRLNDRHPERPSSLLAGNCGCNEFRLNQRARTDLLQIAANYAVALGDPS